MLAVASMLACGGPAESTVAAKRDAGAPVPAATVPASPPASPPPPPDFGEPYVRAAKVIRPSVVAISAGDLVDSSARGSALNGTPLALLTRGLPLPTRPAQPRGFGSGVIVDDEGHVLTNHHVVEGSERVRLRLDDGTELGAKVVGSDPKTDLAVLTLDTPPQDVRSAALGDSDALQVGQMVLACGSTSGNRQTVNAGVLSVLGRGSPGIAEYEDFIQTDAAINSQNSGGPLVDRDGVVIGIATTMASRVDSSAPGVAIPINMARKVMAQLVDQGKLVRGDIGTYVGYVSDELALSFGYRGKGGALVQDVGTGSPAAKAGVLPGDIVVELDGIPVESPTGFRNAIAGSVPRTTAKLKVFRGGRQREIEAQIGELESQPLGDGPGGVSGRLVWGLEVSDITPELQQRLGLNTAKGAVIVQVNPNSPADDGGLRAGDIVASVGDSDVLDADQARRLLLTAKAPVRLRVVHDGRGAFVILRRGE